MLSLDYATEIERLLFSTPTATLAETLNAYKGKLPDPLNRQFPERHSRDEAVTRWKERGELGAELFPSGATYI